MLSEHGDISIDLLFETYTEHSIFNCCNFEFQSNYFPIKYGLGGCCLDDYGRLLIVSCKTKPVVMLIDSLSLIICKVFQTPWIIDSMYFDNHNYAFVLCSYNTSKKLEIIVKEIKYISSFKLIKSKRHENNFLYTTISENVIILSKQNNPDILKISDPINKTRWKDALVIQDLDNSKYMAIVAVPDIDNEQSLYIWDRFGKLRNITKGNSKYISTLVKHHPLFVCILYSISSYGAVIRWHSDGPIEWHSLVPKIKAMD